MSARHTHRNVLAALVLGVGVLADVAPRIALATEQPADRVDLSGQVEVARLVDLAAHRLNVSIEYDATTLQGTATFRMASGLSDQELWQLTHRVLSARGLTTVRRSGASVFSIVKIADAPGSAGMIDLDVSEPAPPGFAGAFLRLQHISTKDAGEAIKPALSKPSGAAAAIGADTMLVTDLWPNLLLARDLLKVADKPAKPVVIRSFPARNLGATQLATLVTQVVAKRGTVAGAPLTGEFSVSPDGTGLLVVAPEDLIDQWESLLTQLDQREPVETVTYPTGAFSLTEVGRLIEQTVRGPSAPDDRWRLITDDLTATLVITATPSQHARVTELLTRLEAVPPQTRRPVRTFPVRNRDVREVLEVLERLVASGALDATPLAPSTSSSPVDQRSDPNLPSSGPASQRSDRASQPTGQPIEPPASASSQVAAPAPASGRSPVSRRVSSGPGANSGPEVTLTADEGTSTIIAVGPARMLDQIAALMPRLDVRQPQVMVEVLLVTLSDSQQLDLGLELERLTSTGDTGIRLSSLFGLSTSAVVDGQRVRTVGDVPGFTGLVISPGEFSIVIRALESINATRSASRPKLLVNNNQDATFSSVLQQPYASTNASTTVATTSFGGTQDAGTTISVRPQIAAGDNLLLEYQVALSSFVGASDSVSLPPPRQQNSVQSTATIPDGFVVAVGGLELDSKGESTNQIPFVSQVPLVGELFKNRSNTGGRTRFYVFIRGSVMRHQDLADLKHLSEHAIREANVDDGWPKVDPQVIR